MAIVVDDERAQMEKIETAPFGTNAYIITCKETNESVLVDAPGEADRISGRLEGKYPKSILITHSHMDHTGALQKLKAGLNVPVAAHTLDADRLPLSPDILLEDGQTISCGKLELQVIHSPGHTPGSLCLLLDRYLISGDTLFPGGPGKTGTPSDLKQIIESLKAKIFVLPDDTLVFPGHGDSTILKIEKEEAK